jgi:hypothetical protein
MKRRWEGKTGLPKLTAIFATVLMISLGLCGANFVAVILFVPIGGGTPPPPTWRDWPQYVLTFTGYAELLGMAVGLLGLLFVGLAAIWQAIHGSLFSNADETKDD